MTLAERLKTYEGKWVQLTLMYEWNGMAQVVGRIQVAEDHVLVTLWGDEIAVMLGNILVAYCPKDQELFTATQIIHGVGGKA
jgi:hypothetical protein